MNFFRNLAPKNAWVDAAVLAVLLAAANYLFSPDDFGWRRVNPSPWLLLPVLIGCRYGFTAGICGGLAASSLIWAGHNSESGISMESYIRVFGAFSGGMIVVGGICGEVCHAFRRREIQLSVQNQQYQDRLRKLDVDLFFLREARSELERLLATRDAELATLDTEIRRLFDSEGDELFHDILLLLNRQARVSDAAIYSVVSPAELKRQAALGRGEQMPEQLGADDIEMISLALKNKVPVSLPEFWQRPGGIQGEHLMAVPLLDSKDKPIAVLLVIGLPFIAMTKKTVHLISLICRWAARVAEISHGAPGVSRIVTGTEDQRVFSTEFFKQNLELSLESYRQHQLPSSIVLFLLPRRTREKQSQLETLVMTSVRGGDFPAELGLPVPHLAVLLPLCGERGANIFLERILSGCRKDAEIGEEVQTRLISFDEVQSFPDLWQTLTDYKPYAGNAR